MPLPGKGGVVRPISDTAPPHSFCFRITPPPHTRRMRSPLTFQFEIFNSLKPASTKIYARNVDVETKHSDPPFPFAPP